MKANALLTAMVVGTITVGSYTTASAQDGIVAVEETVVTEQNVECKNHYTSSWRDNWYIQFGAGMQVPFVDKTVGGDYEHHITAVYNLGLGHWFSPYLGFRFSGYYGKIHYDYDRYTSANAANLNFDIQWDMLNSICGVNPSRTFSIIPYFGVGGMYTWGFPGRTATIPDGNGHRKTREWTLPVSAGIQVRLRLAKNVDFFADARAAFVGDNFNNTVYADPIESNISLVGGLSVTFGEGRKFDSYNPCEYLDYINTLNGRVNDLRGQLAETSAALAAAQAQLPCPEVTEATVIEQAPLMSSVRFKIDSSNISDEEMVNVYNCAQWMKANPGTTIVVQGYADKDTGTSDYNMGLSHRRCQSVADVLINKYGIDPARIVLEANGSNVQPYETNDWNRIVLFTQPN